MLPTPTSYSFNFGQYISDGFSILFKKPFYFILFTLIVILASFAGNIIPIIGSLVVGIVVTPPLAAGAYIVSNKLHKGEETEFSDFFKGFDHMAQLAIIALIQLGIAALFGLLIALFIGFGNIGDLFTLQPGDELPDIPLWPFLLALPYFYLTICWIFAPFFVVFHGGKAWDSMEASRQVITPKWFLFFLFMIVVGFLVMLGAIAILVGLLLTIPLAYTISYAAFNDIVGTGTSAQPTTTDHFLVD